MKKLFSITILIFTVSVTHFAYAEQMCHVKVCNQLKRISLDIGSHINDRIGRTCYDIDLPVSYAIKGKELDSESRWYQGSFNPSKKSKTWVENVYSCEK